MGLDLHISTQPLHTLGKPSQTITQYPHFETWGMMHSCETVNSGLIQALMVFDTYCPRARGLQLSCLWLVGLLPDWKNLFHVFWTICIYSLCLGMLNYLCKHPPLAKPTKLLLSWSCHVIFFFWSSIMLLLQSFFGLTFIIY